MWIEINNKDEYLKLHCLLTSYGEKILEEDLEWLNKHGNSNRKLILSCPSISGKLYWALSSITRYSTKEETIQSLVEHLENKTNLKPLDYTKIVIRTTSTEEQNIFYEFVGWTSHLEREFTSFERLVKGSTDGSIYNYLGECDGNLVNKGFNYKEGVLDDKREIISFKEFQLRKNIK